MGQGIVQASDFCTRIHEDEPLVREWLKCHHPGGRGTGLAEEKVINQVQARQSPGAVRGNLIRVWVK